MSWTRRFLGWDRPAIDQAIDQWWTGFPPTEKVDLSNDCVIVATGTALRDVLASLALRAQRESRLLFPPRVITAGQMDSLLLPTASRLALPIERELAWFQALRQANPSIRSALLRQVPEQALEPSERSLARLLVETDDQLAAEQYSIESLAKRLAERKSSPRLLERWNHIASLVPAYRAQLEQAGLQEPYDWRRASLEQGLDRRDGTIWLLGMVDLRPASLAMLEATSRAGSVIVSLVMAPEELADAFEPSGRLRSKSWHKHLIPIDDSSIHWADDPADAGLATLEVLQLWAGLDPREITVGCVDPEIIPKIVGQGRRLGWEIDPYRLPAPERSLGLSLLSAIAQYMVAHESASLASLIRHPFLSRYLARKTSVSESAIFTDVDLLRTRRLPETVSPQDLIERDKVAWGQTLADLLTDWPTGTQELSSWLNLFIRCLREILPSETDPAVGKDLDDIGDALRSAALLPPSLVGKVSATQGIDCLARHYVGRISPEPSGRAVVRGLGWLDLPLDQASHLVMAGMNEEPLSSATRWGLLTDEALMALGIDPSEERVARNRYALAAILASRKVHFVVARRSAQSDPLTPSQLLLADSARTRARRLNSFFSSTLPARTILDPSHHGEGAVPAPPRIQPPSLPPAPPLRELRVTAFKDFLACPYRFYLRHILKLQGMDDNRMELDRMSFGSLLHGILEEFGRSSLRWSSDPGEIGDFLESRWLEIEQGRYGNSLPSLRVQGDQVRRRLRAFASWQSQHSAEGWEILDVELEATGPAAPIDVDGDPFYLTGRIDRVDYHPVRQELAIIDYKTGESAAHPNKIHRVGDRWTDLQLPLYRHLIHGTGALNKVAPGHHPISLGYVCLPKQTENTRLYLADWDPEDLAHADEVARDVVRSIRREEFGPVGRREKGSHSFEEFSRICQDGMLGHE